MCIDIDMFVQFNMCIPSYVYTYLYIYTLTYIFLHIYIHSSPCSRFQSFKVYMYTHTVMYTSIYFRNVTFCSLGGDDCGEWCGGFLKNVSSFSFDIDIDIHIEFDYFLCGLRFRSKEACGSRSSRSFEEQRFLVSSLFGRFF